MKIFLRSGTPFLLLTLLIACQAAPLAVPVRHAQLSTFAQTEQAKVDWKNFLEQDYQRVFNENDLNHNGLIEADEVAYAPQGFRALDRNQDGHLTPAEALPDNQYLGYLVEQVLKYTQPQAEQAIPASEDPQMEALPSPAEWQQFARELAAPVQIDRQRQHQVPVLLVPGYAEPSWYFMYGIYRNLKSNGWAVEGINLFPNFAPAEEQARKVKAKIEEMRQRYGVDQIDLVVHSFGGLISRYYIQELGGDQIVRNLVTVATPHQGTYTAYLGPGASTVEMRPGSDFLNQLNGKGFAFGPVRYTSIWTNLDEIVVPPKNSVMPESEVQYVPWTGHLTIMFSKRTYEYIRTALQKP